MISLLKFRLLTESIRQGLPHITTMDSERFRNLISSGQVELHHITEKTDGSTFMFGHDENGFYSQSSGSGSEKMRTGQDYIDRVTRRSRETGRDPDYTGARAFAEAHATLQKNGALLDHLKGEYGKKGEIKVRGELFSHQLATPSDEKKGEVKLVGTSYDPTRWGKVGQIVLHSSLPENKNHDLEHFKKNLSTNDLNFEDDRIEHIPSAVDVRKELKAYSGLNHDLIGSRTTPTNKNAKLAELDKLRQIQRSVSDKIDDHVAKLEVRPKFGSGSEGFVIHPREGSSAPRFKVTSPKYRVYKQKIKSGELSFKDRQKQKKNIRRRLRINFEPVMSEMVTFGSFITEGGNIKIKNLSGESVHASPFPVTSKDRTPRANDIRDALGYMHNEFHRKTGEHLFGENQKGLKNGSVFLGSTRQFMDPKISDKEYAAYKPTTGDLDIAISRDHKNKLSSVLVPGLRVGRYTIIGGKGHGEEHSVVAQHDNGEYHQFDFGGTDYENGEPTRGAQFLRSSNWEDTKQGIKGAHHKILLNAVGGDTHKFSITHGLRSRTDETDPGSKDPEQVSRRLFGDMADHSNVHSFTGVAQLIKAHIPPERHQAIYDKFKSSLDSVKADHGPALSYLKKMLGTKDSLNEAKKRFSTQHAHVSFMAASPWTHQGHMADIGGSMNKAPEGGRFIGLSGKSSLVSDEERENIANRQSNGRIQFKVEKSAGQTIGRAFNSMQGEGRRILHLHFGHDRRDFAKGLKGAIENGKIPELNGQRPDKVVTHFPSDTSRSHGFKGQRMREAAANGDIETFHNHLGRKQFSREEATKYMNMLKSGIKSGQVQVKRPETKAQRKALKEDMVSGKDNFNSMLHSFSEFAAKELDLKKIPVVKRKLPDEHSEATSFGGYNPSTKEIVLQTKNRHPMDVFRTLAHEFVHAKQHEDDKIGKDIEKEGATGSCHENEANALAGVIMRKFGRKNPEYFELESLKEAIFVVGGPCSGKDRVIKYITEAFFIPEFDISTIKSKIPDQNDKIIISAPAHDLDSIRAANEQLRALNFKTSMIFVDVNNNISKMRNEERAARGQRVINEEVRYKKYTESKNNLEEFKNMFRKELIVTENSIKEDKDPCWKGYEMIGMKKKGAKKVPNCVPVKEEGRCWSGYEPVKGKKPYSKGSCKPVSEMDKKFEKQVVKTHKQNIPGNIPDLPAQFNRTNFDNRHPFLVEKSKKMKLKRKVLAQEDGILDTASGAVGLPFGGGIGPEFGVAKSPSLITGLTGVSSMSQGAYALYPFGTYGIAESIGDWANKPETQDKFRRKYGTLAEQKLIETVFQLQEGIYGTPDESGRVPGADRYKDGTFEEGSSPAWQRKEGKNPEGGLNRKGVMSYRRENPGSKLQTAVTTKPSKLKKGSKSAKRRLSFCRRMKGMKAKLTSAKTARDPDSRINKSLRKWNCEE